MSLSQGLSTTGKLLVISCKLLVQKRVALLLLALPLLVSCSTKKQLYKAAMTTHMRERFVQGGAKPAIQVVVEDPGLKRVPGMADVRRTRLLVLPLLVYFQVKKKFEVRPGQDNLRFLASNLQAALEEELARDGGLPNCRNCQLAVSLDTVKSLIPYQHNQVSAWVLVGTINYADLHMGPALNDLRLRYELFEGDTLVYQGRTRINMGADQQRPNFFDGPRTFGQRYLEYYYQHLDQQLNRAATQIVAPLRERWGKF